MTYQAAVFYRHPEDEDRIEFLGVQTLVTAPSEGECIQLRDDSCLGRKIHKVVHLLPNEAGWDFAIKVMEDGVGTDFVPAFRDAMRAALLEKENEKNALERFTSPDEEWQKKRSAWRLRQKRKNLTEVGEELGVTRKKAGKWAREWLDVVMKMTEHPMSLEEWEMFLWDKGEGDE